MGEKEDMTLQNSDIPLPAETRKRTFLSSIRTEPLKPEEICAAAAF